MFCDLLRIHNDYKVTKNFANKRSYPAECYNFASVKNILVTFSRISLFN